MQTEEKKIVYIVTKEDALILNRALETYKNSCVLACPLAFYGAPLQDQVKFQGWVKNPIVGGCHWSVVAYALENSYISKKNDWAVLALVTNERSNGWHDNRHKYDISGYNIFAAQLRLLRDLEYKRVYVQEKQAENMGLVMEGKAALAEQTVPPNNEIDPNDIDF